MQRAKNESEGLGLFVRSLVGLDREAAKHALNTLLQGKTLSANQIVFVSAIIDHLTERGSMPAARLYESPYTDFNPQGVEGVFSSEQVNELIEVPADVQRRAVA